MEDKTLRETCPSTRLHRHASRPSPACKHALTGMQAGPDHACPQWHSSRPSSLDSLNGTLEKSSSKPSMELKQAGAELSILGGKEREGALLRATRR